MKTLVKVSGLDKTFTLHQQQGVVLKVLKDISFEVGAGECVILNGPSGTGKSTLLRTLYGNYLPASGSIQFLKDDKYIEMVGADPRTVMMVRKELIGYVSQFLRVIPRVSCLDVVMEPALLRGWSHQAAQERAEQLLTRLAVPSSLWSLAPGTFSGGEQQRVNIARSFIVNWPIMLLDEPTASLDNKNRQVVLELIKEAKDAGSAVIGIFHDVEAREIVMDRYIELSTVGLSNAS
ncbi:MAG: phosphonate C-P lyase system protein PhnL [Alcaligenaceae bacterium]|jgi:alpha-D-ribose 1-methylphosphonate 5-triphosphate synthase subunit PhnL|nr:phosphonate C-P lyase system protein PhnL [Alcaligenaceae bacterium]